MPYQSEQRIPEKKSDAGSEEKNMHSTYLIENDKSLPDSVIDST